MAFSGEKVTTSGCCIYYEYYGQELNTPELGNYQTFGIRAISNGEVLMEIDDVTIDEERIKEFVRECNDGELSLIHIYDVIEDFLGSL